MNWVIKLLILVMTIALTKYIPEDGNKGSVIAFLLLGMLWVWVAGILAILDFPGVTIFSREWHEHLEKENKYNPKETPRFLLRYCLLICIGIEILVQIRGSQSLFLPLLHNILKWVS